MVKVIAITNHKGGVGKTTTAVNLGAALTKLNRSVLLIDLDPQANATSSLLKDNQVGKDTIYSAMVGGSPLPIVNAWGNLDICPANIDLAQLDKELARKAVPQSVLKNLIKPIADRYDYILIDCAPNLALGTINALTAANGVLITLTPEALPLRGLAMLDNIIGEVATGINPALSLLGIVITKYNRRSINNAIIDNVTAKYGDKVLNTFIRENVKLCEAPLMHKPILDYCPDSNGAKDYTKLAIEIDTKVNKQ